MCFAAAACYIFIQYSVNSLQCKTKGNLTFIFNVIIVKLLSAFSPSNYVILLFSICGSLYFYGLRQRISNPKDLSQ
jgi:hypothetical protein